MEPTSLAQIGALGVATATACAVAWARLLLGPPPAQEFVASLWWANRGAALVCIGTALLVVAAVRRPAHAG